MTTLYGPGRARRFWALLSEPARWALRDLAIPVRYGAGEQIIAEGAESTFALVIEAGVVKVTRHRGHRQEIIAIRTVDDIVGEGIWSRDERNASVIALCKVRGLQIKAPDLVAFLSEFPEVDLALRRTLRYRSDEWVHRTLDRSDTSACRLARLLLYLIDGFGSRSTDRPDGYVLNLGLTHVELSQLIGVSERTVQRAFARLRERRAISTDGHGTVVVLDDVKLRHVAYRRRRARESNTSP